MEWSGATLDKEEKPGLQVIRLEPCSPLLEQHGDSRYLGGENHTGLAQLDLQGSQVGSAHGGALHY